MRYLSIWLLLAGVSGFAVGSEPITIHLAGDSTMAEKLPERRPETGWGEALQRHFDAERVRVANHAANGRSTRRFIEEGRWQSLVDSLQSGDYVFIQFGHNDAAADRPDRYTPPEDYRRNLIDFVADVRAKQAIPVLFTPVMRRRFDSNGSFQDAHGEYPDIVRAVAAEHDVSLIDMHRTSQRLIEQHGVEGSKALFLHLQPGEHTNYPEGLEDNTHFSPRGAELMARLAVEGIRELGLGLVGQLVELAVAAMYDFVVAQDGSGDFTTIQAAVDAVRDYTPIPRTIFIKNGVYREKLLIPSWKTGITLIGENVEGTIIDWDDHAGKGDINTFTSYTARISGNDIHVRNITFRNSAGPVGQALALFVEGTRVVFENCRFLGHQDTIFAAGEGARQYFRDVYIEGTTDFIFGPATAYFENCQIHSLRDSYITAASTPEGVPHGFVFVGCRLTAEPGVTQVYLGRPWRDHARTVFIDADLGAHILPEGWHNWSRPEAERTVFYGEYGSTGPGSAPDRRVAWARILDDSEAATYTRQNVLCGRDCGARWWFEPARSGSETRP